MKMLTFKKVSPRYIYTTALHFWRLTHIDSYEKLRSADMPCTVKQCLVVQLQFICESTKQPIHAERERERESRGKTINHPLKMPLKLRNPSPQNRNIFCQYIHIYLPMGYDSCQKVQIFTDFKFKTTPSFGYEVLGFALLKLTM